MNSPNYFSFLMKLPIFVDKISKKVTKWQLLVLLLLLVVGLVAAGTILYRRSVANTLEELKQADSLVDLAARELTAYDYSKAYKDITDAQSIYDNHSDTKGLTNCYIKLATTYNGIGLWDESWKCLEKAAPTVNLLKPKYRYYFYYAKLEYFVDYRKDYASAEITIHQSIENDKFLKSKDYILSDLSNLAEVYINEGKYAESSRILDDLSVHSDKFFYTQLAYCRMLIAKRREPSDSIYKKAGECLLQSVRFNQLDMQIAALETMIDVDSARNDQSSFIKHYVRYSALRDSLNGATATSRINQVKEKAKIDQERSKMKSEVRTQRLLLVFILFVALSVASITLLLYYRARERKKIVELEAAQLADKLKRNELEKELSHLRMEQEKKKLEKSQQDNMSMSLQLAMVDNDKQQKSLRFFDEQFHLIDNEFCRNLEKTYPDISKSEEHLVCLIKAGLDAHEIMSVLNISSSGLYKLRYRLRKRLGLRNENLERYIKNMEG